ncbi:beta family protein [Kitasatospora sp. McL0602]|uniref:beta family protein n=1 Tax=Kitasatospora sp. McL0602 TaxID=3439530 RepID=UPI003F8BFAE3
MEYVPILHGKLGEFLALRNIGPEVQARIRPVLEVVPDLQVADVVQNFAGRIGEHLPNGLVVTVDCGRLWERGAVGTGFRGHAMRWLSESFEQWLHRLIPAFRTTDAEGALDEIRVVQLAHGAGGCLRLDLRDLPATRDELTGSVLKALDVVALDPRAVDLLLDAGYLPDADAVTRLAARAVGVLDWARALPWRHVTLAGGAFPATLRRITPHVITAVRRFDVDLWQRATARLGGQLPDFGDHGVTHPAPPAGGRGGRAAPANLRYTSGRHWHVVRAVGMAGVDAVRICRQLTGSDLWPGDPTAVSWGDGEIHDRAEGLTDLPGNSTQRRAWETSHHLAVVARSIAESGSP